MHEPAPSVQRTVGWSWTLMTRLAPLRRHHFHRRMCMQSSGRLRHSKSPLAAVLFSFIYIQPGLAFGGFSWTQRGIAMIEGCNTSFTSCNLQRSRSKSLDDLASSKDSSSAVECYARTCCCAHWSFGLRVIPFCCFGGLASCEGNNTTTLFCNPFALAPGPQKR